MWRFCGQTAGNYNLVGQVAGLALVRELGAFVQQKNLSTTAPDPVLLRREKLLRMVLVLRMLRLEWLLLLGGDLVCAQENSAEN